MACGDYTEYWEFLTNGQFFDAIYCPYGDLLGGVVLALLFFAPSAMALYIYSGSIILPFVLFLILGSVVIVQLPGAATTIVGAVALLVIAIVGTAMILKMNRVR